MKRIVYILFFLNWFYLLSGQPINNKTKEDSSCYAVLKEVKNFFQNGQYINCLTELEWALKSCSFSKNEKEEALELLAKTDIELDKNEQADSCVKELLKNNPHYELTEENNSEDYNREVKKYVVHPGFSIGIRNTTPLLMYRITKTYSVLNGIDYSAAYNSAAKFTSFFYYGWLEYEFGNSISLNADWIFILSSYYRNMNKPNDINLYFSEADNFTEIPVYAKKYFHPAKNILPYIALGVGYLRVTKATGTASIGYLKSDSSAYSNNIDLRNMRNLNLFEWIAGIGIGYKVKNLRLFIDVRYYGGLNSLTNAADRYKNSLLINTFYYIDNSVKLNQFEIGASASFTLFNSIKKTRK